VSNESPDDRRHWPVLRALVILAAGVCLFWCASNYAEVRGAHLADRFASQVNGQVQVVVYSTDPLYLSAPGITGELLSSAPTSYRYRYSGLRLMDTSATGTSSSQTGGRCAVAS
jgi:hypothetical protein